MTYDLISIDIRLDVNRHTIGSQLAHWQWIGRPKIWPTLIIWLKLRFLIGREPEMLASHWSRGASENIQRGYPYDPEPLPIEILNRSIVN